MKTTWKVAAVTALLPLVLATSACSNGSSPGTTSANAEDTGLFTGSGYEEPQGIMAAQRGKKVWVLSCSQATTNCSVFAENAMNAGKALGWEMNLYDTQFDPTRAVQGVRQAVADGADGIVTYLADCSSFTQALTEAQQAGVLASGAESLDCPTPQYDSIVSYTAGDFPKFLAEWTNKQLEVANAQTDGTIRALIPNSTDLPVGVLYWEDVQKSCARQPDCKLYPVDYVTGDVGANLQQKISQAILQHPDANSLINLADYLISGGVQAALRQTGAQDRIKLVLGEGDPAIVDQLHAGTLNGIGVGIPEAWEAYSAMNNLNSLFASGKPASSGIGIQAFDATHNLPKSGPFLPPVDFVKAYTDGWAK